MSTALKLDKHAGKTDPKEEILGAAEHILSTSGVSAATVRAITSLAGVNTAAISYHFGSRDELFTAVCARRMQPANGQILERLDKLEEKSGGPEVAAIFTPLVDTAFNVWVRDDVLKALRSLLFFSPETAESLNISQMSEVYDRMRGALMRACPHLSGKQVRQRFALAVGTIMNHVYSEDAHTSRSREDVSVEDIVAFIAAGFGAAGFGENARG